MSLTVQGTYPQSARVYDLQYVQQKLSRIRDRNHHTEKLFPGEFSSFFNAERHALEKSKNPEKWDIYSRLVKFQYNMFNKIQNSIPRDMDETTRNKIITTIMSTEFQIGNCQSLSEALSLCLHKHQIPHVHCQLQNPSCPTRINHHFLIVHSGKNGVDFEAMQGKNILDCLRVLPDDYYVVDPMLGKMFQANEIPEDYAKILQEYNCVQSNFIEMNIPPDTVEELRQLSKEYFLEILKTLSYEEQALALQFPPSPHIRDIQILYQTEKEKGRNTLPSKEATLRRAAREGDLTSVKRLLQSSKIDINAIANGKTALDWAISKNHLEVCAILRQAGAVSPLYTTKHSYSSSLVGRAQIKKTSQFL